jgi:hypothetical protein
MLFFFTSFVWRIFFAWFLWSIFYFIFCRFMHLRVFSACFYSTGMIDTLALTLWGMPLGMVAAAALCWGYRADLIPGATQIGPSIKAATCFGVFLVSFFLWIAVIMAMAAPFRKADDASDEVREEKSKAPPEDAWNQWVFSWYNTNPVYVLKSMHFIKDSCPDWQSSWANPLPTAHACPDDIRYYKVGKEYLFFGEKNVQLSMQNIESELEIESWIELVLGFMGSLRNMCSTARNKGKGGYEKIKASARGVTNSARSEDAEVSRSLLPTTA